MEEFFWKLVSSFGAVSGGIVAIVTVYRLLRKERIDETKEQLSLNNELEIKVKELEGRIYTQYAELKAGLLSLEKAVNDERSSKTQFENRVLTSVDRIDSKIERIQDLVLKVFVSNQQK